jgi:hypothetical protein
MRNLILSALILASAFQNAVGQIVEGQWTYIIENGGATITASTATGAVTIPSVLGGYAVKKVGGNYIPIFDYTNTSVTSVVIPNSVTSIGVESFRYCAATSISIPNSVTSIGDYAFSYCTALTSISIPNSVTSIPNGAFYGCTSLASITIPNSVTSIWEGAFSGCASLASITIPNSVTSIFEYAFIDCTALASITIPESVTSIGYIAFRGCTSLVTVYLPARFADSYTNFGLTASQANFGITLTVSCNSSQGTILVNPNKIPYEAGESVVVTATPKAGYLFSNWSGASIATTSSITLTMDARKSVTAIFIQDGGDNDDDDLTNYQESITYGTNPNQKDSNLDGVEDGHAVSMGYSPTLNFSALIAHPPTGLYTTSQIQNMAVGDLVLTKNVGGTFTLNYEIEQSSDLQNWTLYQALSQTLSGLPADKAFVRIKVRQDGVSNTSSSQTTPTTPTFGSSYDGGSGVSPNYATPNYNGGASAISPSPDWLNSLPSVPLGPIEEE